MLYVDDDAPPGGDGTSWRNAHRFLQDALTAANSPRSGITEIRIAQGEYKPDQGARMTPLDRAASFWVGGGIRIAGGYAGVMRRDPDARDIAKFPTVFNGDLLGDGGAFGTFENVADNSIHIAQVIPGAEDALFSGIRFTRSGFVSGTIESEGGGILCNGGGVLIQDCTFEGLLSYKGGAIGLRNARATIGSSTFRLNRATGGGAIYVVQSSVVNIVACDFFDNIGQDLAGGAILYGSTGPMHVANSRFIGNRAGRKDGGAILIGSNSPVNIVDTLFQFNNGDYGGAVKGPLEATRCDFIQNGAYASGAVHAGMNSTFSQCRFIRNVGGEGSGGVSAFNGQFTDCLFFENESIYSTGGAFRGAGVFIGCSFRRNLAFTGGGAVAATYSLGSAFTNSTFAGNSSVTGASAVLASPTLPMNIASCAFVGNTSAQNAAAIEGPATLTNSIVWGNPGLALSGVGTVAFSCIQGGWIGSGNIDADPLFVDALGRDGVVGTHDDDLRLSAASPCIDSGNNALVPLDSQDIDGDGHSSEPNPWDIEGRPRFVNAPRVPNTGLPSNAQTIVDRGPHEFRDFQHVVGDVTFDGVVNVSDLLAVLTAWGPCPKPPLNCPADEAPLVAGGAAGDGVVDVLDLRLVIDSW